MAEHLETELAAEPQSGPTPLEQKLEARLASAGCRLRNDKVASRLITGVRVGIPEELVQDQSIIFTIAAPIRCPAKTIGALIHLFHNLPAEGLRKPVHDNTVQARRVGRCSVDVPGVMGFVHGPERSGSLILDLVEDILQCG